jgi:Holliday junction resolvasome RuvABC ATP-dependent DNA helicase subunit
MREILERRIDINHIDKAAAELMIENSAGVPREFVRMLRNSCVKAISRGFAGIETDTVGAVIAELRNEYERGLEKRHMEVLKAIERGEPVEDHNTLMELFHSKVVLEYLNDKRWTAINPIVKPLLE